MISFFGSRRLASLFDTKPNEPKGPSALVPEDAVALVVFACLVRLLF